MKRAAKKSTQASRGGRTSAASKIRVRSNVLRAAVVYDEVHAERGSNGHGHNGGGQGNGNGVGQGNGNGGGGGATGHGGGNGH